MRFSDCIAWKSTPAIRRAVHHLPFADQAMREPLLIAVTFAAEIGDVRRFDTPRQLMSFLGLVPAESSTGDRGRRKG